MSATNAVYGRMKSFIRKKAPLLFTLLCIVVIAALLGHYYECQRKEAKRIRSWIKEENIKQMYRRAKNLDGKYPFGNAPQTAEAFNMDEVRKIWNPIGFMMHVPYTMFHYSPMVRSRNLNTNNIGFRGKEDISHLLSIKPDPNYRYIVLLGGSAAFGAYSSSPERCIARILEHKMNSSVASGKKFKVLNLGMGFYNSFQELIAYILYGLKYNPEVVVTFDGFNDCVVPLIEGGHVPLVPGNYYKTKDLIDKVNRRFTARRRFGVSAKESCWEKDSQAYEQDVAELYRRNLDLLCLIARDKGSQVLLTLQPIKIFPNGDLAYPDKSVSAIYAQLPGIIKKLAQQHNCRYIDFQEVFARNLSFNEYFPNDTVHLSDRGQEIIATYMYEELKKMVEGLK